MFSAVHLLSFVKFVALLKKLLNNYMIADLSAHPVKIGDMEVGDRYFKIIAHR